MGKLVRQRLVELEALDGSLQHPLKQREILDTCLRQPGPDLLRRAPNTSLISRGSVWLDRSRQSSTSTESHRFAALPANIHR